jgi:exodeoxyribonuclease VII large subunit
MLRDRSRQLTQTAGERIKSAIELVVGLGPEKTLARGFSIARRGGKTLSRKSDTHSGDDIELQFADGVVGAKIN